MLVSPQWPLFACQSLPLIGRDESRYNLVPPRSAKFNSQRDNPEYLPWIMRRRYVISMSKC